MTLVAVVSVTTRSIGGFGKAGDKMRGSGLPEVTTPEALHHLVPILITSGTAWIFPSAPVTHLSIRPRRDTACPGPTETGDTPAAAETCSCSLPGLTCGCVCLAGAGEGQGVFLREWPWILERVMGCRPTEPVAGLKLKVEKSQAHSRP